MKYSLSRLLFALTFLVLPKTCESYYENVPFEATYCGCCFEVGADFLWWKQSADHLDFGSCMGTVTEDCGCDKEGKPLEKTKTVHLINTLCPKWKPGVRAQFNVRNFLNNANLRGSYTFIRHSDKGSFSGSQLTSLIPTERVFDIVSSNWRSTYQAADLLFTFPICSNPCFNAMPFFGVEGIYLTQKLNSVGSSPFQYYDGRDVKGYFKADAWGVGLKVGSDYEYTLTSCLKVFGRGSLSMVSGSPSIRHSFEKGSSYDSQCYEGPSVEFCENGCSHMMPGFQLQSGVRYLASICRVAIEMHLGYEFVEWLNVPNTRHFIGEVFSREPVVSTTRTGRNLGFNGLFFGGSVAF
jgi:hypothetical protein